MRKLLHILLILLLLPDLSGQDRREGKITYITSQHVYVKFDSMEGISEGDTLFINQSDQKIAALVVQNLSSVSCVCIPLLSRPFKVSESIHAILNIPAIGEPVRENPAHVPDPFTGVSEGDSTQTVASKTGKLKQEVSGRISVSSYTNLANGQTAMNQRMRYTFSLNAKNLGNSKFSVESYLSFAHSSNKWDEVKANIFNGLKIYNLSASYDFNETTHLGFGRKINPKLSSVGAIDGLQFEKKIKGITLGAVAGSRPDYKDYGFNLNLLQYGGYLGYELAGRNGNMQNTIAFIEQTNQSETDRRFAYFQHTNTLVKNLFFFGSAEVDLYKMVNGVKENIFDLSNTYLSLRYRIARPLSIGLSYSARRNIIYYETYKDFLERLLETETLQGWRFRINYRPAKYLFLSANAGYRFRKDDPRPTMNANGNVTYSQVPGIGASVTLSATWLETNYLNGIVYGAGISKDIVPDKLSGGLKYRYVDYLYRSSEMALVQHVAEANISWTIYRKLLFSVYYEGTFEKEIPYHRVYLNISQRF